MTAIDLNEFISNPSPLSKDILEKYLLAKSRKYENAFSAKGFFKKIINNFKLNYLYQTVYLEGYNFIENFKYELVEDLDVLLKKISIVFEKIILNNILLAYAMIIEKSLIQPIYTKGDLLLEMLSNLYHDKIKIEEFNKYFGHYSNNEYEPSIPRYAELSETEIMKLAKFSAKYQKQQKQSLVEYIKVNKKKLFPVYAALREEYKYIVLFYIKDLRQILLKIQKEKKIDNIFNYSLNMLLESK